MSKENEVVGVPIVIPYKDIYTFNSDFGSIRCIRIDGDVYMIGKDVAKCLGYKDTKDALAKLVPDAYKLRRQITASGQRRYMIFISEPGLYKLVLSSKMPKAKEFSRWVVETVLPSIREHGEYVITNDEQAIPAMPVMDIVNPRSYIHHNIDILCENSGCTRTSAWVLFRQLASYKYNIDFRREKYALEEYFNYVSTLDMLERMGKLKDSVDISIAMASYKNYEDMFKMFDVNMNIPDKGNTFPTKYKSFSHTLIDSLCYKYTKDNASKIIDIAGELKQPMKVVDTPFDIEKGFY